MREGGREGEGRLDLGCIWTVSVCDCEEKNVSKSQIFFGRAHSTKSRVKEDKCVFAPNFHCAGTNNMFQKKVHQKFFFGRSAYDLHGSLWQP